MLRRAAADADGSVPILTCFFNPTPEDRTFKLPPPQSADAAAARQRRPGRGRSARSRAISLAVKARSVVLTRSVYRP